jgi:hypothetical protein
MEMIPPTTITDAMLHSCSIAEPSATDTGVVDYQGEWASGTNYSINAIVLVVAQHRLYISLVNGNQGFAPGGVGNDGYWFNYRSTERWLTFDGKVTNQAAKATSIVYELLPGVAIDSMSLHNIEAETVTVILKDGLDGATLETWTADTYDNTLDLYSSDIVKTDFLYSSDPHFTITLANSLTTAKVGEIVIGNKEDIGTTQYTPTIGIIDYSIKEVDTFGNYTVLERAYSKRLTCSTVVLNTLLDHTYNILAARRALASVWVGSDLYASMIVYGFYKDFSIVLSYPTFSICELEIEGLV